MIYLLKFGASLVLPPGIFFVLLWAVSVWCWRRREKRIAAVLAGITLVFYLCSTSWVSGWLLRGLEYVYVPPAQPQGDVIVMLGGGATKDTPDVDGSGALCAVPANRLLTAVRLQRKMGVPILVSGGQVYEDSGAEAEIARRVLLSLGVPAADILVENRSLNTTQNAQYSVPILREHGLTHPILVTSAFHMKRAVLNFAKQGMAVTPYPADYQTNREAHFHYSQLQPQSGALLGTATVLQERLRTLVTQYLE